MNCKECCKELDIRDVRKMIRPGRLAIMCSSCISFK